MVNHIIFRGVPYMETHSQKRQPHCIVRGFATGITFDKQADGTTAHIVHHSKKDLDGLWEERSERNHYYGIK